MNIALDLHVPISKLTFAHDLHKDYGLAELRRNERMVTVWLNGVCISSFDEDEYISLLCLRWLSKNQVIVWIDHDSGLVVSLDSCHKIEIGRPSKILVSNAAIAAVYGEYECIAAAPGDLAYNLVSFFTKTGEFIIGLRSVLERQVIPLTVHQVIAAYMVTLSLVFFAYSSKYIWKLHINTLKLQKIVINDDTIYPLELFGTEMTRLSYSE